MITFGLLPSDVGNWLAFKRLHNVLFKHTSMSSEWMNWYFGLVKPRVYCAFDGHKIIGIWCVEPKELMTTKGLVKVGRCFSVGIDPDYQRRGIFIKLSQHAIQEERKLGEYEFILGFPRVGRAVIGGHLKAGWKEVMTVDIVDSAVKIPTMSLGFVDYVADFEKIRFQTVFTGFLETSSYKNARWLSHPDCAYVVLTSGLGYIVLKPFANSVHVLELKGPTGDTSLLLDCAKTLAYRHGWCSVNAWCAFNDVNKEAFDAAGFTVTNDAIQVLAVNITSDKSFESFVEKTQFQAGGEEMY